MLFYLKPKSACFFVFTSAKSWLKFDLLELQNSSHFLGFSGNTKAKEQEKPNLSVFVNGIGEITTILLKENKAD